MSFSFNKYAIGKGEITKSNCCFTGQITDATAIELGVLLEGPNVKGNIIRGTLHTPPNIPHFNSGNTAYISYLIRYIKENQSFFDNEMLQKIHRYCSENGYSLMDFYMSFETGSDFGRVLGIWVDLIARIIHDAFHQLSLDDIRRNPAYLNIDSDLLKECEGINNIENFFVFSHLFSNGEIMYEEIMATCLTQLMMQPLILEDLQNIIQNKKQYSVLCLGDYVRRTIVMKEDGSFGRIQTQARDLNLWVSEQSKSILSRMKSGDSPEDFYTYIMELLSGKESVGGALIMSFLRDTLELKKHREYIFPYLSHILMTHLCVDEGLPVYKELYGNWKGPTFYPALTFTDPDDLLTAVKISKNCGRGWWVKLRGLLRNIF